MRNEVIQAKVNLYNQILYQPLEELTKDEIDMMWILARDPDIQKLLEQKK